MANDLGVIDITKPDGASQGVNVLDDYERETRSNLVGWAGVEHDLKGRHKVPNGNTAGRPPTTGTSPALPGTIYINTETGTLEYYNGTTWVPISNTIEDVNYCFNGTFGYYDKINSVPTTWTLFGGGTLATLDFTDFKTGVNAIKITNANTIAGIYQDVHLQHHGLNWWRGKSVSIGAWVKTSLPNFARIGFDDGVNVVLSDFHTGSGNFEFIAVGPQTILAATATQVRIYPYTQGATGVATYDGVRFSIGNRPSDFIPGVSDNKFVMVNATVQAISATDAVWPPANTVFIPQVKMAILGFSVQMDAANANAVTATFFRNSLSPTPAMACSITAGQSTSFTYDKTTQFVLDVNDFGSIHITGTGLTGRAFNLTIFGAIIPQA